MAEKLSFTKSKLKAIKIKILRFISNDQPGYVECAFRDAWNKEHIVHEKVPIVTDELLDANTKYPKDGVIACEILDTWVDSTKRTIHKVTTNSPWLVATVHGLTEFDVSEGQLIEISA